MVRPLLATFALALCGTPAWALEPVPWGGPGWYLFASPVEGPSEKMPVVGPLAAEDRCVAERTKWIETDILDGKRDTVLWCAFEEEPW